MELRTDKMLVCPSEINLKFKMMKIMCPREVVAINHSMQEIGQNKPLRVASTTEGKLVLLDGFKRHLAAAGMNWSEIEVEIIGDTIERGIFKILSDSVDLHMHILEQSKFIGYMADVEGYTTKQIAIHLGKSVGWVSNRKNFSTDCPPILLEQIFLGLLPSSSYAMTFRKFIQNWECSNDNITPLVKAVSGKNLSFRQVDELVTAYFTMGNGIPQKIIDGKISAVLALLMPSHRIPLTQLESKIQKRAEHAILTLSSLLESLNNLQDQTELTAAFRAIFPYFCDSLSKRMIDIERQLTKILRRPRNEEKD